MGAEAIEYDDHVPMPNVPMTESAYLALSPKPGQRVELVDGELLVSPVGDIRHQHYGFRLGLELDRQAPDNLVVLHGANVRLGPDRLVIPDVVVATSEGDGRVLPASDVLLVAEVVSPSSRSIDRILKPRLCAEAGIPWYLRIERERELELLLWRRRDDESYEL